LALDFLRHPAGWNEPSFCRPVCQNKLDHFHCPPPKCAKN
jgi:hypothetical protein